MTGLVWLNFPLCALVFLAIAGIPLWFVLRHEEWGPANGCSPGDTDLALFPAVAIDESVLAGDPQRYPELSRR